PPLMSIDQTQGCSVVPWGIVVVAIVRTLERTADGGRLAPSQGSERAGGGRRLLSGAVVHRRQRGVRLGVSAVMAWLGLGHRRIPGRPGILAAMDAPHHGRGGCEAHRRLWAGVRPEAPVLGA